MGIPDIIKLFSRKGRKFYFFCAKTAGYWPHSTDTFEVAFVHRSVSQKRSTLKGDADNERLEYLGDAVIETVVSDILYHKYPEADEGFMSRVRSNMVCRARLNSLSFALGLDEFIVMNSRKDLAKSHISGDVLEAFVAAIYLDGGWKRAFNFVKRTIATTELIESAIHSSEQTNYKSMLVNYGEQNSVEVIFETRRLTSPLPEGVVIEGEEGDMKDINFVSDVIVANVIIGTGYGRSKKAAEQMAAGIVYKAIEKGELDIIELKKTGHLPTEEKPDETDNDTEFQGTKKATDNDKIAEDGEPYMDKVMRLIEENAPEAHLLMAEKADKWKMEPETGSEPGK